MNIKQFLVLTLGLSVMIFIIVAGMNYISSKQHADIKANIEKMKEFNNREANVLIKMKKDKCVNFSRNSDLLVMSIVLDKNHCIIINP